MRTQADPLTIAYMALGAKSLLMDSDRRPSEFSELDYVEKVIDHALMADKLADPYDDEGLNGVFVYEVAEPLGRVIGQAIIDGEVNIPALAEKEARELLSGIVFKDEHVLQP